MSGILAGALGGAGRAVSDIAGGHIQNRQQMDLHQEQMQLEEQKERRKMEWAQRIQQDQQERRARVYQEMPEGLSEIEQAEYLQRQGYTDEADGALDRFKADSERMRSEASMLTAQRDPSSSQQPLALERQADLYVREGLAQNRGEAIRMIQSEGSSGPDTMNVKANDVARELQMRFGTRDNFGVFSINEDMRDQYTQAYRSAMDMIEQGMPPARAADVAYREATNNSPGTGGADGESGGLDRYFKD